MKTAVILPTWNRTQQAVACVTRFLETSSVDVVIVTEDERAKYDQVKSKRIKFVSVSPRMTAVQKWNYGLECHPDYEAYFLGADDLWPDHGWHDEALRTHKTRNRGCIGINDGVTDGDHLATHYLMTREFIAQHNGGVMACPHYRSWSLDLETTERAKLAGQYAWAQHASVEHRHVHFKKAAMDETYKRGYGYHSYDALICERRRQMGWPNDFEAVIA